MGAKAASPTPGTPPRVGEPGIDVRMLHFAINQAVRNAWTVGVICAFIAATAFRHTPHRITLAWLLAVGMVYGLRAYWLRPACRLETLARSPNLWRRRFHVVTLAVALVVAVGPTLVFPTMPEGARMYLTMVLCCWLAGAMAVFGPVPKLYTGYALLFMGGTALGWVWVGSPYVVDIVSMLLIYALVVAGFCQSFGRLIADGMSIRHANERLLVELRQAKEAAEESSRAKTRFLAVASHDLRQPLHALMMLNGLLGRVNTVDRATEVSGQMGRSLRNLDRLFTSLLDFSRFDSTTVEPDWRWQPADDLIELAIQPMQAAAQAKGLRLHHPASDVDLRTDPELFTRMLRNLVDNAIKFTNAGGIEVAVQPGTDQSCLVTVTDTGRGIPENLREDVFKEYFQAGDDRGNDGLGLGLAIVRRLAQALAVQVQVADNPGGGTRFELRLPAGSTRPHQPASEDEAADQDGNTPLQPLTVLCIDDDPDSLDAIDQLLRSWGLHVRCARSADEALAVARQQAPIDVVLSDYSLGDGPSGNELIYRLRELIGEVPAALISGDSRAMQAHQAGQIEFPVLAKPLAPAELRQLLEVFQEFE
jgi:signal transduction histidine kinase/CheY-like chemotaxis protein